MTVVRCQLSVHPSVSITEGQGKPDDLEAQAAASWLPSVRSLNLAFSVNGSHDTSYRSIDTGHLHVVACSSLDSWIHELILAGSSL